MNKIAIPAILVATVMVAGMFAFMPVEQASTVHTSAATQQASMKILQGEDTTAVAAANDNDEAQITIQARDAAAAGVPFTIKSIIVCATTSDDAGAAGDVLTETLTIDGDAILAEGGGALTQVSIADGDTITACVDIVAAIEGANAGDIGDISSDGGTVVFGVDLVEFDTTPDQINSVKVVVIAQGDATTVFVDAALV